MAAVAPQLMMAITAVGLLVPAAGKTAGCCDACERVRGCSRCAHRGGSSARDPRPESARICSVSAPAMKWAQDAKKIYFTVKLGCKSGVAFVPTIDTVLNPKP
jgi:hypothetical protein